MAKEVPETGQVFEKFVGIIGGEFQFLVDGFEDQFMEVFPLGSLSRVENDDALKDFLGTRLETMKFRGCGFDELVIEIVGTIPFFQQFPAFFEINANVGEPVEIVFDVFDELLSLLFVKRSRYHKGLPCASTRLRKWGSQKQSGR
ncbi:MAG TPA: hypothetical protein VGZ93_08240 [Candidatus Methylacidiphilales bacterium]|jgi:hypothetical protein|nr:hypothetical protein [Candidatus Methylacidiphilales bacterium]